MLRKEWMILYHTILIGASPLIPIPFLDELLVLYLRRHLVADIARSRGKTLTPAQIRQFADEPAGTGCIGISLSIVAFFIMELVRDFLFWLEWKRGVDLATETYHFGYLADAIFAREDFTPQNAQIYRQAIKESLAGFQTEQVHDAIRRVFSSSRTVIRDVRNWLFQFGKYYMGRMLRSLRERSRRLFSRFRRRKVTESGDKKDDAQDLDDFLKEEDPQGQLTNLIENLSRNLEAETGNMQGYFGQLFGRLEAHLKFYSDPENAAHYLARQSQPSSIGIASFVTGLLALSTVPLIVATFYGQRYWDSPVLRAITAWMPCLTALMILMGAGTGFISLSEKANRNRLGVLGVLLSSVTFLSCCVIFGLVFMYSNSINK